MFYMHVDGLLMHANCNVDGLLQDKWGSMELATGIHNCGYGHTMGTGVGVPWVRMRAYVLA